jgi:hypothetical protein
MKCDYITVTKITVIHTNITHQKLYLISCSLSHTLWMLDSFSHSAAQFLLKTCCLPINLKFSHHHLNQVHSFSTCFLGIIRFWGGIPYFHKIKGQETLSRSHNNQNTTDNNPGLTESFHAPTELCACGNLKLLVLKLFSCFLTYYFI